MPHSQRVLGTLPLPPLFCMELQEWIRCLRPLTPEAGGLAVDRKQRPALNFRRGAEFKTHPSYRYLPLASLGHVSCQLLQLASLVGSLLSMLAL